MIIIVVKDTLKRKDSLFDGHTVVCYLGYLDSVCDGDYDYDDDDDDDDVNIMHHLGQRCMLTIVSALQIQNLSRLGLNS